MYKVLEFHATAEKEIATIEIRLWEIRNSGV